jgi:hypothetical protein
MQSTVSAIDLSASEESSATAVSWGPIVAGAFAASTLTFILMLLGSGLGLSMVSPWSGSGASVTTFAVSTAIWLIIVQWLSSGVGGYLAGRLRTKWVGIHTDEVYFRDTAHGFLAWALATLLVVGVLGSALSAALGSGVQAVSTVASGAAMGASAGASANAGGASTDNMTSYLVDSLFRPADPSKLAAANSDNTAAVGQASRILIASAAAGEISADDKTFALLGALSLVIGAFIASAAAALGGRQRDDEEAVFLTTR